jgi:hypothetical protein
MTTPSIIAWACRDEATPSLVAGMPDRISASYNSGQKPNLTFAALALSLTATASAMQTMDPDFTQRLMQTQSHSSVDVISGVMLFDDGIATLDLPSSDRSIFKAKGVVRQIITRPKSIY